MNKHRFQFNCIVSRRLPNVEGVSLDKLTEDVLVGINKEFSKTGMTVTEHSYEIISEDDMQYKYDKASSYIKSYDCYILNPLSYSDIESFKKESRDENKYVLITLTLVYDVDTIDGISSDTLRHMVRNTYISYLTQVKNVYTSHRFIGHAGQIDVHYKGLVDIDDYVLKLYVYGDIDDEHSTQIIKHDGEKLTFITEGYGVGTSIKEIEKFLTFLNIKYSVEYKGGSAYDID